jgi:hypothetical protein
LKVQKYNFFLITPYKLISAGQLSVARYHLPIIVVCFVIKQNYNFWKEIERE